MLIFIFLPLLGGVDRAGKAFDKLNNLAPQAQANFASHAVDPKQLDEEEKKLIDDKSRPTLTPGPPSLGMNSKNLLF